MTITKTALHIAASLGHEEVVRVLLAAKAQVAHALPSALGTKRAPKNGVIDPLLLELLLRYMNHK